MPAVSEVIAWPAEDGRSSRTCAQDSRQQRGEDLREEQDDPHDRGDRPGDGAQQHPDGHPDEAHADEVDDRPGEGAQREGVGQRERGDARRAQVRRTDDGGDDVRRARSAGASSADERGGLGQQDAGSVGDGGERGADHARRVLACADEGAERADDEDREPGATQQGGERRPSDR